MNLTVHIPDQLAARLEAAGISPEGAMLDALRRTADELDRDQLPGMTRRTDALTGAALIAALQASISVRHRPDPDARRVAGARRIHVTGWLLDTNILSELRRGVPEPRVVAFVAGQPEARRAPLQEWLERSVRPMFAGRVLPITEDILLRWRLMVEVDRKAGHTFPQPDLMIAATAFHHGHTVVSRDVSEFQRAGVPVFNPWVDHDDQNA